jgi:pimeloyl-ACP methyl ester carboxylesterase
MGSVVLVHGAWHGAWCWDGVVAELGRRGVAVDAVELPLTGLAADVTTARAAIVAAGDDVVVCGHSYGGVVISHAAAGVAGVKRLVYLAAFQTDVDEDPMTFMAADPSPLMSAVGVDGTGLIVDPARLREVFYADSDPGVVEAIADRLRPMPVGDQWLASQAAWTSIPSTYIVCTRDSAILPSVQRRMAARADEVHEWDTDHSPFLTRPAEVAGLLASLV